MPDDLATYRRFSALATEQVNPATAIIDRMSPLEIVRVINAADAHVAGRLLAAAGGEIRTAVVMAHLGLSQQAARARLQAHGRDPRVAVDAAP